MPKKRILSVLLLMIIASLYTYFLLSYLPLEPTLIQQSSSLQLIPKESTVGFDRVIKDQQTSSENIETTVVNTKNKNSIEDNEVKSARRLDVSGTITNEEGQALAGVLIYSKGEFPPIFTDTNGQYQINFAQSGFTELLLNVSLSGYKKRKVRITKNNFTKDMTENMSENTSVTLDVTLAEALDTKSTTSFIGNISNRSGEAVANQQIHLITLGDYSENEVRFFNFSRTDENGNFTLKDVSINTRYQLVVLAGNGYDTLELDDLWVSDETPDINIVLEDIKLTTHSGQVIDREGVPLPNLTLNATNISNGEASEQYTTELITDESGMFLLENFPEGAVNFSIKSPAEVEITGIYLSELNAETLILPIDVGNHFITGVITDSNGEVIEGVTVTLQSTYSNNALDSHSVRPLKSDSTGAFAFSNFGPDRHTISIFAKGFEKQSIVHEPYLSDTHLNIVLERR